MPIRIRLHETSESPNACGEPPRSVSRGDRRCRSRRPLRHRPLEHGLCGSLQFNMPSSKAACAELLQLSLAGPDSRAPAVNAVDRCRQLLIGPQAPQNIQEAPCTAPARKADVADHFVGHSELEDKGCLDSEVRAAGCHRPLQVRRLLAKSYCANRAGVRGNGTASRMSSSCRSTQSLRPSLSESDALEDG